MTDTETWEYRCVGCSELVIAGADFAGECPKCHGSRWLCHKVKVIVTPEQPDQPITPPTIMSPLKLADDVRIGGKTGVGDTLKTGPGRKQLDIPVGLIKKLAGQGLGVKQIASRLSDQGIVISYRTVQRRIQGGLI